MRTYEIEGRRYRRTRTSLPVRLEGCSHANPLLAETMDVSTGGTAITFPTDAAQCRVGDRVVVEVALEQPARCFSTEATVCSVMRLQDTDSARPMTRLGLRFREALLLSEVPAAA